jgi:AraC-like DNA-binding protein
VVRFYAVLAGEARLEVADAAPVTLSGGDLVVLPHPVQHTLSSRVSPSSSYPESVLESQGLTALTRSLRSVSNDTAFYDCIVSGRFSFEPSARQHWWPLLPPVIAVRDRAHTLPWLESTLRFIASESDMQRPGTQTLVMRLTDLLVFEVIREYLAAAAPQDAGGPSGLSALSEPQIGTALALLDESPQEAWTVARLARKVGMSRSAFAARFVRLVGEPPLHYLTRLRMQKAAALLRDGWDATAGVAEQVGYVSDTAFCKAFKRAFGQSPGAYCRAAKNTPEPQAA